MLVPCLSMFDLYILKCCCARLDDAMESLMSCCSCGLLCCSYSITRTCELRLRDAFLWTTVHYPYLYPYYTNHIRIHPNCGYPQISIRWYMPAHLCCWLVGVTVCFWIYLVFAQKNRTDSYLLNLCQSYFGMDYHYSIPLTLLTSGQPVNICAPMVRYSRYLCNLSFIRYLPVVSYACHW